MPLRQRQPTLPIGVLSEPDIQIPFYSRSWPLTQVRGVVLVVSIVYMKVLWNLQEGSPGKLLYSAISHGNSEFLPGVFLNGRNFPSKNRGFAHWITLGLYQNPTCPSCAAATPHSLDVGRLHAVFPINQLPNCSSSSPPRVTILPPRQQADNNNYGPLFQVPIWPKLQKHWERPFPCVLGQAGGFHNPMGVDPPGDSSQSLVWLLVHRL